jgi:hypothetical protein
LKLYEILDRSVRYASPCGSMVSRPTPAGTGCTAKLDLTSLQHPNHGGSAKTHLSEAHSGRLGETARTIGRAAPNLLAALPFSVALSLSGRDARDQIATAGAFDSEREVAAHLGGQFRYNLRR